MPHSTSFLHLIKILNPAKDPRVTQLVDSLNDSLTQITGASGTKNADLNDFAHPDAVFLLGLHQDKPIACGGFRKRGQGVCEIKRMFSLDKGKGWGRQILQALEQEAKTLGYETVNLETRRVNQGAVNFYLSNGYQVIENYGFYKGREEAICFAKEII